MSKNIQEILGEDDARSLLDHTCNTIKKENMHLPGPDFIDRVLVHSDRSSKVLRNLNTVFNHGRLGGTGLISGRKTFQKPMKDGIELLHAIQDMYRDADITVA